MRHITYENLGQYDKKSLDGVFIHPTNSCYGFGAKIDDEFSYKKIYDLKGRSIDKPFFITISALTDIEKVAIIDPRIKEYLSEYSKTTFTFILKRSPKLADFINPGYETVGVQVSSGILKTICDSLGGLMFGTSANFAGEEPIYTSGKILEQFGSEKNISFIDAGDLQVQAPSTIVDLSSGEVKILRGKLPY